MLYASLGLGHIVHAQCVHILLHLVESYHCSCTLGAIAFGVVVVVGRDKLDRVLEAEKPGGGG
jgi:hypothetical protein